MTFQFATLLNIQEQTQKLKNEIEKENRNNKPTLRIQQLEEVLLYLKKIESNDKSYDDDSKNKLATAVILLLKIEIEKEYKIQLASPRSYVNLFRFRGNSSVYKKTDSLLGISQNNLLSSDEEKECLELLKKFVGNPEENSSSSKTATGFLSDRQICTEIEKKYPSSKTNQENSKQDKNLPSLSDESNSSTTRQVLETIRPIEQNPVSLATSLEPENELLTENGIKLKSKKRERESKKSFFPRKIETKIETAPGKSPAKEDRHQVQKDMQLHSNSTEWPELSALSLRK